MSNQVYTPQAEPGFLGRYLLPNERCVIAVRRHPAQLLKPLAIAFGGLLVVFFFDVFLPPQPTYMRDLVWLGWLGVFGWLGWKIAEWWVDYFVVTDQRLLVTYGLLTHRVAMMPLPKVTDMSYKRTVPGRLLGYGEFIMESAGQDQALSTVTYVPRPDTLYLQICDLLFGPQADSGD